ncbi:MAG: antibiotic biosynthesis monooxygenase [Chloroflexi bacterium]|jgi:heme-degrading monooxygenase HmoA|nr:antibiotic biosynthesis monooxygenase [Chloroflexota bacterium]
MIERHVTFTVHPEKCEQFEKLFIEEYRPAMASMPGFVSVGLLREQEDPHKFQMVIRFESAEAAAAWRESDRHKALSPRLKALYSESQLKVYDVVA